MSMKGNRSSSKSGYSSGTPQVGAPTAKYGKSQKQRNIKPVSPVNGK